MGLRELVNAEEWDDETANIPCRDDNRFAYPEQIASRQSHIREGLAYRCHDCVLFTLCSEYTAEITPKPSGVIQAGKVFK